MLAKNKKGQIGRHVRTLGETVDVAVAPSDVPHSTVLVDYNTLAAAEALNHAQALERASAFTEAKRLEAIASSEARVRFQALERSALSSQSVQHPLQDAFKVHFAIQQSQTQTERVLRSIKADFRETEMMPAGPEGIKSGVRSADFNQNELRGNVLVRDGVYGRVTDFDRIVEGTELDNDVVAVAGTMLRNKSEMSGMSGRARGAYGGAGELTIGAQAEDDELVEMEDGREIDSSQALLEAGMPSSGTKKLLVAGVIAAAYFLLS